MIDSIEITDSEGKQMAVGIGEHFRSKTGRKESIYQYLGIMTDGYGYEVYLHNETNGVFLNVETSWFSERKIELVG